MGKQLDMFGKLPASQGDHAFDRLKQWKPLHKAKTPFKAYDASREPADGDLMHIIHQGGQVVQLTFQEIAGPTAYFRREGCGTYAWSIPKGAWRDRRLKAYKLEPNAARAIRRAYRVAKRDRGKPEEFKRRGA